MKRSRLESPGWDCFVATKTLPLLKQLRKRPADVRQFDLEKSLNTFFVALPKLENNFWLSSTSITKNPGVENVGIDWKFPSSTGSTSILLSQNCKHSLNCPKQAETPKWAVFFSDPKIFLFTTHPPRPMCRSKAPGFAQGNLQRHPFSQGVELKNLKWPRL